MHLVGGTELSKCYQIKSHYIVKLNVYKCHLLNHSCMYVCVLYQLFVSIQ